VLERGEKLDNLVERSNALSAQSKMFYKTAKKVGSIEVELTTAKLVLYCNVAYMNVVFALLR
jgi:hypothetical protein